MGKRQKDRFRNREYLKNLIRLFRISFVSFAVITVLLLIIFVIYFYNKYSFGKVVNSVVVYKDGISIIRFDPFYNELLTLNITDEISAESAGGFGNYPLKNIYSLSENEKRGEEMFRKTIMRNFHLPIYNVIDCRHQSYNKRSLLGMVFYCGGVKDMDDLTYLIYTKWKTGNNKTEKNLNDLRGVFVQDAESDNSFRLSENLFEKLELDFSQSTDVDSIVNVSVKTADGGLVPEYFSDIIRIMGGRVVESDSQVSSMIGIKTCMVSGSDRVLVKNLGKVFGCETQYLKDNPDVLLYFSPEYLTSF